MPKPKIPNQRKAQLEHKKRIERYVALINQLYDKLNKEASKLALATDHDPAKQFLWSDYPQTKAALEKLQSQFISEMQAIIMAGTSAEWKESNLVQDLIAKKLLKAYTGSTKSGEEYTRYFETNPASLQAFQQRRAAGMNLSTRVWNLSEQYKTELEMAVSAAIEPGTSAMELAADIKKYLNEPDIMFRRFRYKDENGEWKRKWKQKIMGSDGKVHFIDADPTEYHPGRGVYRSSARNAQRLARTEINMAYRTAEQERWRQFDFVVGYEVKTTQNGRHVEDICDCLAGKYRKDFKFLGWHPACYEGDMEVLTNAGWRQFKDISNNDLIMSLNPDNRELEYVSIVDRQCYDFDGKLVRFFNKSLDCAVTPEHRMVYLNKGDGRIKYCPASEFRMTMGAFYRGAMYDAEEREWFEIEGRKIRFDDYCAFMGYYLSDGSLQSGTGVTIAQQAGRFAFYDIADTIAKMGYNISFTPNVINIYNSALNRYLSQFGTCLNKYIPNEIKTASKRQIQIFLDAFIKCDGHTRKCKSFVGNHGNTFHSDKEERMYFTTSERLAGDLSELILKVGHRPSFEFQEPKTAIKKDGSIIKSNYLCYRIRECYSTTATVFKKELMPYSGKVYDLTLERNHIMYVRRNGKCFWGSNCMCYSIPILKTEDEFFDDEDAPSVNEVEDVPQGFKDWIRNNEGRINAAEKRGTLPYFIRDNRDEVDRILHPDKEAENAAQSQIKKSAETVVNPKPEPHKPSAQEKNHQELAKVLGVEQGEPMSFEKANEMRGNPYYKKGVKYRVNCQCSVLANEMRRRGFDVEAYGNTKQDWYMPSVLAKKPEIAFFDANGNPPAAIGIKFNGDLLTSLQGEMKEPGRYHLRFRFQNDGGHVITAERLADGSLRIYDPQSGKIIKNFSEYTSKVKGDSFEYYRVDNLQINPDVAKGSVKLAKSKGDAPRMQLPEIKDFLEKGWYGEIKADIADYIKKRNIATTNREKVKLDIEMVKNGEFVKSEYHSTAKGSIFATEELPKKIDKSNLELSKNIQMAKKMVNNGYDVYLLSNPRSGKSADFIFSKGGKVYYTEGKLSTGKNSLGHNLAKGSTQSERILVDLTGTNDTNYITTRIEEAFKNNSDLKEVMLLKGGRLISIMELTVQRKDFNRYFKRIWEQKK